MYRAATVYSVPRFLENQVAPPSVKLCRDCRLQQAPITYFEPFLRLLLASAPVPSNLVVSLQCPPLAPKRLAQILMDQAHRVAMNRFGLRVRRLLLVLFVCALPALAGCFPGNGHAHRSYSASPPGVCGLHTRAAVGNMPGEDALIQAEDLDRLDQARCVDLYYRAAMQSGRFLSASACSAAQYESQTYRRALAGLIEAGQHFGRLDPRGHLTVYDPQTLTIPITYHGFAWQPHDFSSLVSADQFQAHDIAHRYTACGLGISLVGIRQSACKDELFFRSRMPFAVTAVLRPASEGVGSQSVLEFYNPHAVHCANWNGASVPLSRDLTAPLAAIVKESPRQYLRGFTAPGDTEVKPQLVLVEPYQRGKIPVVFIHGLYSDPITWVDTANELRAQSDISAQYQFWTFRYPTGGGLLESVAVLRERLRQAYECFAPNHDDPALNQMVLVGHSLGGLVAKMQIVTSHDILWNKVAIKPFSAFRGSPEMQMRLSQDFFFEPLPFVTRVVFIATPHHGSSLARRAAGRLGNTLIRFDAEEQATYRETMANNCDVFRLEVTRRRPTSVDLLEPTSPFLAALAEMPLKACTHMHSIIGTGGTNVIGEQSDGVVTVSSAKQCGVESEIYVPAKHEKVHRDPDAIVELERILRLHANLQSTCVARENSRQSK